MPAKSRINRQVQTADKADPVRRNQSSDHTPVEQNRGLSGVLDSFVSGLDSGFGQQSFDGHVALLGDSRFAHPANTTRRVEIMRQLQRDYGNTYVQRVVERVRQNRATIVQTKLTVGPAGDSYERIGMSHF